MKPNPGRRQPRQRRAVQTVEAILDAVIRILKREGVDAVTTNHIAEMAGVSIGSVYQYFPDKQAIFVALHDRHVEQVGRLLERTLVEHASSSLEALVRALIEAMIEAHAADPELHELLFSEVPHGATGSRELESRLRGVLRLVVTSRAHELGRSRELERTLFVLTQMVDALAHGAVLHRPSKLSLSAAKDEAVRAVMAYLRS